MNARAPGAARSTLAAPVCFTLLSLAGTAGAAGGEPGREANPALESVVVTATRIEQSLLDVAEAVSVIEAGDVTRRAPELLAELLRGVPGAFVQQTTPGQGIPIIRGLKGSQVLHLVDGMRLNNAFFRDAPNQYFSLVDAYAIRRAEVIRGSAPSLYGADAMGGVVHVLTAEPLFDNADWSARGRVYGHLGSAGSGLIARAEAAAGNTGSALSGGVTYQDHGDRVTGGGVTVAPTGYRAQAADLKWRRDLGEYSELTLSAQYLEQPSTPRIDELVPGFGQDAPSSALYEFSPNRRDFMHARYRVEGGSAWFRRFEAHLARQVMTDDRRTQEFGSDQLVREFNRSTLDGLTLQFNSPWGKPTGGAGHELVWGFEYYADAVDSSRYGSTPGSYPGAAVAARFPDGSTMDSAAAYASSHWNWRRLSLDAGLRLSSFRIVLPASREAGTVRLTPRDLTGDLHFSYEFTAGTHLVSNLGRGFRPPNIFDLGTLGSRPGNRFNVPNPDLQPESVYSYDLGIKMSRDRWQLEAFAWYSDYRHKISSRLTGELTPEGRSIVRSDNLNEARLHGFEAGARYLARPGFEWYAVVNHTHGEERDAEGNTTPADRIPPLNARVGMVWTRHGLRIEPYLDLAGRQERLSPRDLEDPRLDPEGTSGWATVNLLLGWQATPAIEVGLGLRNLGDRSYREHGSGIDAAGRSAGFWFSALF